MKILITGITGRVGANVARKFLQNGHDVRGFVWPGDRQAEKMQSVGAEIVEGDLASSADVNAAAAGQEVILHLGAAFQAGGPFTPEQYMDTNVKGTFNVLQASLELGDRLKHVIVTSTDATMFKYPPNGIDEPIAEDSLPLVSTDWYGYSKVLCENLVDRYCRHENLRATVIRFANVWGAGEILKFPAFHLATFLKQFESRTDDAGRATYERLQAEDARDNGGQRLIVARDANGRPWKKHNIEVRDIVHAYEKAVGNTNTFGRVYQIGAKEPFTWDVLIPYMSEKTGIPYSVVDLAMAPNYYEYDLSAARNDFGYDPRLSVFDMVDEAVRYNEEGGGGIIPTRV
ncbi:MAG: NAD(P)-dependent oxidoreductase [Chloroflexi bacterium]|nr:NAD(P)-dependent oxidoreductase [Chloroflexota bacterium]